MEGAEFTASSGALAENGSISLRCFSSFVLLLVVVHTCLCQSGIEVEVRFIYSFIFFLPTFIPRPWGFYVPVLDA